MVDEKNLLDSSFMKLQQMHHLASVQVIIVINWIAKCRNKLKHTRGQVTHAIWLQGDKARMN